MKGRPWRKHCENGLGRAISPPMRRESNNKQVYMSDFSSEFRQRFQIEIVTTAKDPSSVTMVQWPEHAKIGRGPQRLCFPRFDGGEISTRNAIIRVSSTSIAALGSLVFRLPFPFQLRVPFPFCISGFWAPDEANMTSVDWSVKRRCPLHISEPD